MTAPMTDAEIREALARAEAQLGASWELTEDGMIEDGLPSDHEYTESELQTRRTFIAHARTDVPRLAADLLAARAERDEARASLSTPTLAKRQPCGCVVCTCGDVERCGGCGARMCDRHRDDRPSLANDPATVWEAHPLLARAETAEARCRELEAERAIVADYLRDTDADFRARRPSDRAVLDALLSPPPPHTCQIHRATSGASDCGLSPCEEAKVHTDRGASRPATVRRAVPAVVEKHGPYCPKNPDATIRHMVDFCTCGPTSAGAATPEDEDA